MTSEDKASVVQFEYESADIDQVLSKCHLEPALMGYGFLRSLVCGINEKFG